MPDEQNPPVLGAGAHIPPALGAGAVLGSLGQNIQISPPGMSNSAQEAVAVQMAGVIGNPPQFNLGDDSAIFLELLEQYFQANGIADNRKSCILLTSVHSSIYKIIRSVCDPVLPSRKTFSELCGILKNQFTPHIPVFRKRIHFYSIKQEESENVKDWFVRIKEAALDCKFGAHLNDFVKDRFVSGMKSGAVLDRLCEEDVSITLDNLVRLALSKESCYKSSSAVPLLYSSVRASGHQNSVKSDVVNQDAEVQKKELCFACGGDRHNFSKCKFKKVVCSKCKRRGHIAKVCQTKSCLVIDENDGFSDLDQSGVNTITLFAVDQVNAVAPFLVPVIINNVPIEMELDTGAGISILPKIIYDKHFSSFPLSSSNTKLQMYDRSVVVPDGVFKAFIRYGTHTLQHKLTVVKNGVKPLLGRDLIHLLGFKVSTDLEDPISSTSLNNIDKDKHLEELLHDYRHLFEDELGIYKYEVIDLKLKDPQVSPIFCKPRQVPIAFRSKVEEELKKLEDMGVIVKVEHSNWGTPLVPVLKPNGKIRLCVDYKVTVNKHLEDFNHPIPRVEDLFQALRGGKRFTKLDFSCAYNQLPISQATGELLAWSTHKGIYMPTRLPFGPKTACSIFQSKIEKVLQGCKGTKNYFDDIVITGGSDKEHIENLRQVLEKISQAGLRLNKEKCKFFQSSITYLGHIISESGIKTDSENIQAIQEIQTPTNVSEVRSFVGMVNFYGKFIPHLSDVLEPLHSLLRIKKGKFIWDSNCQNSFVKIKKFLSSDLCLVHYDPSLQVKLVTDASAVGISGVLLQIFPSGEERPICFASRTLTTSERNYSVIHREALAIYWSVLKFNQYLLGRKFILASDHKPLLVLFGENKGIPIMGASRLQRWALVLSEFDYTFEYIKGTTNVADWFSRFPRSNNTINNDNEDKICDYVNFVQTSTSIDFQIIQKSTKEDKLLDKVKYFIINGWPKSCKDDNLRPYFLKKEELSVDSDVIMWGYRLIIPSICRDSVLQEIHSTHMGASKMKALARSFFWWPHMDEEIEKFSSNCPVCLSMRQNPPQLQSKWPESNSSFERVHIDFLDLKGTKYLILTDSYSKWPEVIRMSRTDVDSTLDALREIFARFGIPITLVSDNGPPFQSSKFEQFCTKNKIRHITSPVYHPNSNGAVEVAVKSFKHSLTKMIMDNKSSDSVSTLVSRYLLTYRNTPHWVTEKAPAELLLGRNVRTILDFLRKDNSSPKTFSPGDSSLEGRRNVIFHVGEVVYVRSYEIHGQVKWMKGIISDKIGNVMYLIKLPDGNTIKRHIDQIIKFGSVQEDRRVLFDDVNVHSNPVPPNMDILPDNFIHNDEDSNLPLCVSDKNVANNDSSSVSLLTLPSRQNISDIPTSSNHSLHNSSDNVTAHRPKRNVKKPRVLVYTKLGG